MSRYPELTQIADKMAHEREREMEGEEFAEWAIEKRESRERRAGHASL